MNATAMLIRSETKMVVRDYAGLIVPLALPLLILVTSAGATGDQIVGDGRTVLEVFVLPIVFAIVIAMIGIVNMPSFLATYRKTGILRRLAVTPVSPLRVLSAQVVVSLAQAVVGIGIAYAVAVLAFGAGLPARPLAALGVVALSVLAMYSLGMVIASLAPTPNSSVAIGMVVFFAVGALGGMFGGMQALPGWLQEIGAHLPFGATTVALGEAWLGQPVGPEPLLSLAVCAVLGTMVSALTFRWDR
jgi:ABC-2 type transport system permease protein